MKLFLSYPSAERHLAERLTLALEAEGHEVFFDRSELPAGEAFHQRLRQGIQDADAMVFLVTPGAVAHGAYTLTELDIARQRWRRPAGHVLPVMVAATNIHSLPPYLAAVTVLQPQGELVAATVAAVATLNGGRPGRARTVVITGALVLVLASAALYGFNQQQQRRAVEAALQRDAAAAAVASQLCDDGSHGAAMTQLAALAANQPASPVVATRREDCAMRWLREMRATRSAAGVLSFDQQVAIVQPVLAQALAGAQGQRAADLRAHLGWGEYLRRREGVGAAAPEPHWQRAIADDANNVYARAMWGNVLMRAQLDAARMHFDQALASGRERAYVRHMQMSASLGGSDELTAYAVAVADEMRRGGETLTDAQRGRLWSHAFGSRLLDPSLRQAVFTAVPAAALLATYEWLFPAQENQAPNNRLGRFNLATLQAQAGQRDAARAGFESLLRDLVADRSRGPLLDQSRAGLAALKQAPG